MAPRTERKLAAILAADVVGYSHLVGDDEAGTIARLKVLRKELIEPLIAEHRGRIVKLMGDGALVEFASAVYAVECAVAIQKSVTEREAAGSEDRRIRFRIGINVGDIIVEDGDILGDGVNVAARLEGLAEPGSICISAKVYEEVRAKLRQGFEDLGEKRVKNIHQPVRAYRVLLHPQQRAKVGKPQSTLRRVWAAAAVSVVVLIVAAGIVGWLRPWQRAEDATSVEHQPLKLPSKPSIAVLPFANLNNDADEELFIDGLTNDIITDLSKFSGLFVIAANSTFQYKGKAVNVQDVARDLGVRYVLEGSVQRSNATLRINAQLIDATNGAHVWAERYDRASGDFFATQSEITRSIVGVISPLGEGRGKLQTQELARIDRTATQNLQAYDYFLQGMVYMDRGTREDNLRSRAMFENAIELDPAYAKAIDKNTWTYLLEYYNGWTEFPEAALAKATEVAQEALRVDPNEPWAYYGIASSCLLQKKHDCAVRAFEKAHELNPNDATLLVEYGWALALSHRPDEGIPLMHEAIRLNPFTPEWYWQDLAEGNFVAGHYADALTAIEKIEQPYPTIYRVRAAIYALVGRLADARADVVKYMELEPQMTLDRAVETMPFSLQEDYDRFRETLRKVGLPEKPANAGP